VLYATDLEKNANVCPKCGYHNRIAARERLDLLLDPEGRFEIGVEIASIDSLKFKDDRRYPDRLEEAEKATGETEALIVMQGAIKNVPLIVAAFEFEFMGGSMGSAWGSASCAGCTPASTSSCRWCASRRPRCAHAGRALFSHANGQDHRSLDTNSRRASSRSSRFSPTRPWVGCRQALP